MKYSVFLHIAGKLNHSLHITPFPARNYLFFLNENSSLYLR